MTFTVTQVVGTVLVALASLVIWRIRTATARRKRQVLNEIKRLEEEMGEALQKRDMERVAVIMHRLRDLRKEAGISS